MDEDYVQHMFQKYRLAVALAVLQNKPNDVNVENYIADLQLKIRNSESNETLSNISVDEDDFKLSDDDINTPSINLNDENSNDSITILQNYDFDGFGGNEDRHSLTDVMQVLNNEGNNQAEQNTIVPETSTPNLSQSTHFETTTYIQQELQNNAENNLFVNAQTNLEYSKIDSDLRSKVQDNLQKDRNEHKTFIEKDQSCVITDFNIFDSQETEIYSLHGFTEYNTHISQSQDNFIIAKNYLLKQKTDFNIKNNDNVTQSTEVNLRINDSNAKSKVYNYINNEIAENQTLSEDSEIPLHVRKKPKPIQYTNSTMDTECINSQIICPNNEINIVTEQNNKDANESVNYFDIFTQDNQLFSTSQDSLKNSETPQSQNKELIQQNSNIYQNENNISLDFGFLNNSTSRTQNSNQLRKINFSDLNNSQIDIYDLNNSAKLSQSNSNSLFFQTNTMDSLNQDSQSMDIQIENLDIDTPKTLTQLNNLKCNINNEVTANNYHNEIINTSELNVNQNNKIIYTEEMKEDNYNKRNFFHVSGNQKSNKNCTEKANSQGLEQHTYFSQNKITNLNEVNIETQTANKNLMSSNERNGINERTGLLNERIGLEFDSDDAIQDLSDSQAEIVPFKVIEELNKIKMYLNKRNRLNNDNGTDSGYKSNSRESYLNASQSNLWLNQSSHCLFTYLSQCPLLVATMEINYEIAKVLGLLVDRLHEDEKYPSFLEEMLEFIDNLLQNIYEGNFDDDNVFLKNDENIDRLLLLNKSQNIIKFTIEKITNILEKFHERLEKGVDIELENINTAENLCFIFHILEILLKKYSTKLSQCSQPSQDEKILKRSTLTEIWRKKWNLTKTEVFQKEEIRDVTSQCCDVLNKIIVKAMDGYSLVAFAALQCFNLLQS